MNKTSFKNKFIGDRAFYKTVLTVAMPIMLQNLITNFVSLLDNFMVGSLEGSAPTSGVAIANQVLLIVHLALFGMLSGVGIYTAQFYGKGNVEGIRYSMRFKLYVGVTVTVAAVAIIFFLHDEIIGLFIHDEDASAAEETVRLASDYILTMLAGLTPFALAQVIASTLRETGDTRTPMIAGFAAVGTNVVFNYILIFGKFGAPALGVVGAAAATVLSRFVELAILLVYAIVKREKFPYMKGLLRGFGIPRELLGGFFSKGASLMANEVLWSGAQTALGIAYSLHGLDVVAGYGVAGTVINLFFISCMAFGVSAGIIVGKELGAGRHDEAVNTAYKMLFFSLVTCVVMSLLLALVGGQIPKLYSISDEAKLFAVYFITVSAIFMPADAVCNNCYFTIRSGGKTLVTFIFDAGSVWAMSVPAAFGLYYIFHLNIYWVYPIVVGLNIVKAVIGLVLLRRRTWVNTIV